MPEAPLPCPTPWRITHPTYQAADRQRTNDRFIHGAVLHPYKCRCSAWHLTPNLDEELPTHQQAQPEDVERLRTLGDTAFTAVVDADVKKTAAATDRLALRHTNNLTRWHQALEALQQTVRTQLKADGTPQWRNKAQGYEEMLSARLTECLALQSHAKQLPKAAA